MRRGGGQGAPATRCGCRCPDSRSRRRGNRLFSGSLQLRPWRRGGEAARRRGGASRIAALREQRGDPVLRIAKA